MLACLFVRRALLALLLTLSAGCGASSGTGPLFLSWAFVDGRRCTEAGASTVSVRAGDAMPVVFTCLAGEAPQMVTLEAAPRGGRIEVTAVSPQNEELYRGETTVGVALPPTTVRLFVTFSR